MGETFGNGTWRRPGPDRQRGHCQNDLQDRASFDHEDKPGGLGCLLIAMTILAALAALIGTALT